MEGKLAFFPGALRSRQKRLLCESIHRRCAGLYVHHLPVWLKEHPVKQRAIESTGKPGDGVRVARAKIDRIDVVHIAEFLQYGLLRVSFVPPRSMRELRYGAHMQVQLQCDRNRLMNPWSH